MYVRDPDTKPVFRDFDPKKMLDEYYRRIGGIQKATSLVEILTIKAEA
jgi:hypothetical protein